MAKYVKLNEEPIEIKYGELKPCFEWNGETYFLDNFIRTHNNPYMGGISDCPDYIHGYEATQYWSPLFIEIIGSDYVNVYEYKED